MNTYLESLLFDLKIWAIRTCDTKLNCKNSNAFKDIAQTRVIPRQNVGIYDLTQNQ